MRIVILIALTVVLASGNLFANSETVYVNESIELISCSPINGYGQAVKYSITFEKLGDFGRSYMLNKHDQYRKVKHSVRIPEPKINLHGNVLIVTIDAGRSGYVHIYSNIDHDLHLFEVNLVDSPELNTENPKTIYRCSLN